MMITTIVMIVIMTGTQRIFKSLSTFTLMDFRSCFMLVNLPDMFLGYLCHLAIIMVFFLTFEV